MCKIKQNEFEMEKQDNAEETAVFQKQLIEAVTNDDIRNLRDICSSLPKEFNINFEFQYEHKSETLIHLAVSKSVEILNVLLEKGANIQVKSHQGRTLLHVACMKGNVAAVKRLLEIGQAHSFINAVTSDGETAIHLACWWPAEMMISLKENGADIHMKTKKSENTLHLACKAQNIELVKYLLENVPDSSFMHAVTCAGIDPFSIVTSGYMHGKQRKILELLLSHGYSANSMDRNGSMVLMNAVVSNDYELAELLCKHGANVNLGTYGNSYKAIHWASERDCNAKMIKLLINHGANINQTWRHGQRPIHLALKHSKTENARVLLDAGADVSGYIRLSNPRFSYIPTLCLAAFRCPSLVPQFLARGANPNEVHATSGLSVLGILIENGASREVLKSVIQAGANINKGCCGKTAIQCCENLEQIFAFLESGIFVSQIESQRNESLLLMAISKNYHDTTAYDAVSKLISLGCNPNYTATGNDSALILSLKKQFWKIVNLLISKGGDLNHKGLEGNTALHVCCQKGYSDGVEQLLTAGALVNVENKKGLTPLLDVIMGTCDSEFHVLSSRRNIKTGLLRCLLNHGADVNNVFPTTSESTLYHVCSRGDSETTKLLIDAGYDVNKLEKNGRAPIFACLPLDSCRKTDTIKILLENGASPNVPDENGTFLLECVFQQLKQPRMHNYLHHSAMILFRTRNDDLASELRSVFRLLLQNGADPNGAKAGQDSLLLQAIKRSDMEDVVKTLIEFGADVCHVGENQRTAFEECLNNEDGLVLSTARGKMLSHLIEANFPLNKPLVMENYPLELVLMYENTDSILQDMFSKGVDPNKYKEGNEPPLVLSVKEMRWLITLALMEAGADLFVKTKDGITAIDLFYENVFYDEFVCCSRDHDSTVKIIKNFEFAISKMMDAEEDEMKKIEVKKMKRDEDHISVEPPIIEKKGSGKMLRHQGQTFMPEPVWGQRRYGSGMKIVEANTCCEIIKAFIEKNETSVNNKTLAGLYPLTVAVKLGSTSLVNFLLEKKADPNCMDHMNDTPLSLALIYRNEEMVRSLVKARANINHCGVCPGGTGERQSLLNRLFNDDGYTTYSKGVPVSLAQFLIENGTSVNHDEEGSDSPLVQAVRMQSYDLVDFLLTHGANVNHPGRNRSTALHECIRDAVLLLQPIDSDEDIDVDVFCSVSSNDIQIYGDSTTEIFQCLLKAGASVNSQTDCGDTPVHLSIKERYFELTSKMLNKDFNPNIQNCDGTTSLMLVVNKDRNLTQHLLNIGADPSIKDNEGNTTLHHFCSVARKTEILDILLKSGSDINALNNKGYSPLNTMIEEKAVLNTQDVLELLAQKADPNKCVEGANSPLINSLLRWKLTIAECLLNAGVNVNHVGESGRTALHTLLNLQLPCGIEGGRSTLYSERSQMFLTKKKGKRPSDYDSERIQLLKIFLKAGADVNKTDLHGNTGLMHCLTTCIPVRREFVYMDEVIAIVRCLLTAGADANIADISGRRPLEIVVDLSKKNRDEVKILELTTALINHGAKYNDYEKGEDSLLHMAVDNGLQEVVDFLVRKGADINHRGKNQQTPLHRYILKARKIELPFPDRRMFSHQKPTTIMDTLLSMTEDPDVEDEYGDSPLNLASHVNADDFRKLLKAGVNPLHKGKENVNAYEKCIMSEEVELLEVLLQEKGSIYITDSLFSDFWNLSRICDKELYQRVMLLMLSTNEDIDLNRENSSGEIPLTFFCQRNATEVISKLLERGADIKLTTTTGRSALHSVLDSPDDPTKLSTIAVLMSNNPDLEGMDASSKTVLQKAMEKYLGHYSYMYRHRASKCLCTFMEHLLNAGATCDQSDLNSVLHSASERQHFSLMTAAVKRGADLFNKKNGKGVLHRCWPRAFYDEVDMSSMLEGCIEYIKTHKQLGGCLDEVDDQGNTPLLAYVKSDLYTKGKECEDLSDEVVALLATNKDVVCKTDVENISPLHITASRRRLNSMKILVNKGADLFSKDKVENSCLHKCLSSEEGHLHVVDMVRYILENGISPNEENKRHETALFLIIQRSKYHTGNDVSTILNLLIKHGANPNQENSDKNPLVTAIQKFDVRPTEILLKNGANVNELSEGPTALHVLYRCLSYSYSTINEKVYTMQRLLLKKEMNLNAKDSGGKTVLHVAVMALRKSTRKDIEAVKLIQGLIKHGADVNATDKRDLSALCICIESGYCSKDCIKLGKYLLKAGADPKKGCSLNLALKRTPNAELKDEWKSFILKLIANGANTNSRLDSSSTPSLILAIDSKDMDIVRALLEHGVDSNAFDYIGTSLIHACRMGNEDAKQIISLLLQHGCNINQKETKAAEYTDERNPLLVLVNRMIEDDSYVRISRKSGKMTAQIDLTLFNLFVCGGCKFMVPTRERYTGSSVLAKLTKAGYFKAAEILVRCGYNFKEDVEFKNLDFSSIDAPTIRVQGKRYKRVDHENAKTEFQDLIKNCEEEPFSLVCLCRRTTRQHLGAVHGGSEIETKIKSLPLPNKVKEYLNYRVYTQEYEEFDVDDDSKSETSSFAMANMLAYLTMLNGPVYSQFSYYDSEDDYDYCYYSSD
ncbi:uncharacterized protein LOC125678557 [Ostrea edulis]|uniref:uncharacterized protein LOC125678557 n=1 Tax=Ostrea edulis TaxID=37623 RepID=UPI0024AE9D97|nr:uncharacterized protein LOC125678557 [Ostrea edulis]